MKENKKDDNYYVKRAERLLKLGNIFEAIQACDKALEINPKNERAKDLKERYSKFSGFLNI